MACILPCCARKKIRTVTRPNKKMASYEYKNYENWMGALPENLRNKPLNELAIPGSHDSSTSSLDPDSDLAPDEPGSVQQIVRMFGKFGRNVMLSWSKTQDLTFTEQLMAGIRYFDFRVATRKETTDLYFVHGFYAAKVEAGLKEIYKYLESHPKEVVLLDFNHFYAFTDETHGQCISLINGILGDKMCPYLDIDSLTLNMMNEKGLQAVVFYQSNVVQEHPQFWPACSIQSLWANTFRVNDLIDCLDKVYNEGRPEGIFYCWQGVLTPDLPYVIMHFTGSVKNNLAMKANPSFCEWLKGKTVGKRGINICLTDYVHLANFVPQIISMNFEENV
ncbi:hypothetical protein CHS0354_009066 [Potamilus streckersoni]|uniref:PI-PLC X domain-containing protein 3 n=1 Tax=Potamilus streckersoni TaxID=2493646 RepID=A0AAE0TIJ1_9BIVA|nr:hypothetical protein CHS0354_009066 [Potamilus streckersoni]